MEELKPCPYSRPQISHAVDRMTLTAINHEPSYLWPIDCHVALWALKNISRSDPGNKIDLSEIDRVIRLYEDASNCPCDTYAQLILAALREYKAGHAESKPLTLEQLKNMRDEAVWVKDLYMNEIQCLQFDDFKPATYHTGDDVRFNQFWTETGLIWWCCKYGETWLPYAHKPEGSENP